MKTSLGKVNSVLNKVEGRMEEFLTWINHIKQSNMNEEIPEDIVSSLQEIIRDNSEASSVESIQVQVEEMSRDVIQDRTITSNLQSMVLDLQEKLDEVPRRNISSSTLGSKEDLMAQYQEYQDSCVPAMGSTNRERDIVRKSIERMERQISQLIGVVISKEHVNIALLKKCKTVDVPAVNSAVGHIQKALQKYVGFKGGF